MTPPKKAAPTATRKMTWKETKELETMEAEILKAEEAVAGLETAFASPEFYQTHGDRWQQKEKELADAKKKVAALYKRWAELEALA